VARRLRDDLSASAAAAGFVAVLVGFTSSVPLVFQAARAFGATPEQIGSWIFALGLGMGVTSIALSLRYRMPVVTAWSTPGAAMLISSAAGVPMDEAIGAFLACGVLITFAGYSGVFERLLSRIPLSIAAAMLAGVLLRFGIDVFTSLKAQPAIVGTMIATYLLARRIRPRYAVLLALAAGVGVAGAQGVLGLESVHLELARPVFTAPAWSVASLAGIALPLFVVTMASQNVPGVATMRASGYAPPVSPLIGATGVATLVLAPFGAFALNLAAITAAICMGREAHEDPARRYVAAMAAGLFYLVAGAFGATVGALLAAFPAELVLAIAGLALLGTIGGALTQALFDEREREPALITFLVTASGLTVGGIGAAFWGLVAGAAAHVVLRRRGAR
jgi:benzoate membrane transport protein